MYRDIFQIVRKSPRIHSARQANDVLLLGKVKFHSNTFYNQTINTFLGRIYYDALHF